MTGIPSIISAVTNDHNVVVDEQGLLWAWGSNNYGQLANGDKVDQLQPKPIAGLSFGNQVQTRSSVRVAAIF